MSKPQQVLIPDLGGATDVEVIEVLVATDETVSEGDSLITLESDKASMEVPCPFSGNITSISVKVGDSVNEGDVVVEMVVTDSDIESSASTEAQGSESADPGQKTSEESAPIQEKIATTSDNKQAPTPIPERAVVPPAGKKLAVIGSGPGGYAAAFRAADLGMDVTLIERYAELGGVCLNVGCIPSKALLHSAAVISAAREMQAHGIQFSKPKIDVPKLRSFKQSVISKLTSGLAGMAKARKVKVVQGFASFVDANTVNVVHEKENQTIKFDQAIIAAGSRVASPTIFDIDDERVIDSTGALELNDIPKSLLIIGGGIIGLEMATVYSELGSKVTIVEFLPQIMMGADKDLVAPLQKRLKEQVEDILTSTKVTHLEPLKSGIKATITAADGDDAKEESQIFEKVLVATGRKPNSDMLEIENSGVQVNEQGFIEVDDQMRTSQPHIYAIGDIVGQPMLAHKATHEGKVAAEVAAGHKSGFDAKVIPSVAYTDPEVAWVGLTETEAKAQKIPHDKAVFPWAASGRAIGNDRTEGKTKLIIDPETNKILGGGIVGTQAGDLIAEVGFAIEMGADVSDLALTIHPHPTLSETVAMAAEIQEGTITDLYLPKKR
ncbi:MAG: dihydrolipoyl dehydrogenase [Pseudomonadota bacterium]